MDLCWRLRHCDDLLRLLLCPNSCLDRKETADPSAARWDRSALLKDDGFVGGFAENTQRAKESPAHGIVKGHFDFHSKLVARIPGLKSETWGTHRLVAEGVRDEEKDCRSLGSPGFPVESCR
jgi:hypothetical protein